MVRLKTGLLSIGGIIFMVFPCPHAGHPLPGSSVRLPVRLGMRLRVEWWPQARSRHGHRERKESPLPKPISNRCMFFTHCAKKQPSTARDGGTSMLVREHPREIRHAHPQCPAARAWRSRGGEKSVGNPALETAEASVASLQSTPHKRRFALKDFARPYSTALLHSF